MKSKFQQGLNWLLAAVAACIFTCNAFSKEVVNSQVALTTLHSPDGQNANRRSLVLSGSTTRKMFFLNVYKISYFIAPNENLPTERNALIKYILTGCVPQRVELEFLRDVTPKQVERTLIDGIERNNPSKDLTHIEREITRLSFGFDDKIQKHSMLRLERQSGSSLSVFFNNEFILETTDTELINALWTVWFGNDPIVKTDALLSQLLH